MAGNNPISALLLILITIFLPPLGVFMIAGCGADILVNICLTLLGYFPGHIHAFYLEYVYFDRRGKPGVHKRAGGIYSENVQTGGQTQYGTVQT